jgi:ribosomal protein S18 acetylase RimI-like enzyme
MRPDEFAAILDIAHAAGWARAFKDDYASRGGRAEHYDVRVATVEGKVAGFCEGRFASDFAGRGAPDDCPVPHAYATFLAVQRDHRRVGIGRALMLSYAADAKAHGCSFLALSPVEDRNDAERLAFFRSLGLTMVNARFRLWGAPIIDLV